MKFEDVDKDILEVKIAGPEHRKRVWISATNDDGRVDVAFKKTEAKEIGLHILKLVRELEKQGYV